MQNQELRKTARENGVMLWQLADEVGVAESTLYRYLRRELPAEQKVKMLAAIRRIAAGRKGGENDEDANY